VLIMVRRNVEPRILVYSTRINKQAGKRRSHLLPRTG